MNNFKAPDRNAGYGAPKSSFPGYWDKANRPVGLPQIQTQIPQRQPPSLPAISQAVNPPSSSQTAELKELAQKTPKQVREWLREQVAALEDSSSD